MTVNCRDSRVAVVVPALNAASTLPACLGSLNKQSIRPFMRIIVVDNGSTDDTALIAERMADEILIEEKPGVAAAKHRGLLEVTEPFVFGIDADCMTMDDYWAERYRDYFSRAAADVIGLTGPVLPIPTIDRWAQRLDQTPAARRGADGTVLYAVGCNHAYRTSLLRDLGGFARAGAEDAAFSNVARRSGYSYDWVEAARVLHRNYPGWRGYGRQMVKVGGYAAGLTPAPRSLSLYGSINAARAVSVAIRQLLHGEGTFEASASCIKAAAQTYGAVRVWRSL